MKTSIPVESTAAFDARMEAENREAETIICPLGFCRAQVGQACITDSGVERIRHCRRLWMARKMAERSKLQ